MAQAHDITLWSGTTSVPITDYKITFTNTDTSLIRSLASVPSHEEIAREKYLALTEVPYDGGAIYLADNDKWFAGLDELIDHCADEDINPATLRLHPCKERQVGAPSGQEFLEYVQEQWAQEFDDYDFELMTFSAEIVDLADELSERLHRLSPTVWDSIANKRITPLPPDPDEDYDPDEDRYSP